MSLPEPTASNPRAQLKWLFGRKTSLYDSYSTKKNYRSALQFYYEFLDETSNYSEVLKSDRRFFVNDEWGPTALLKLKRWTERSPAPSSRTSNTVVSHIALIRQVMRYAYELGILEQPVVNVPLSAGVRETTTRTAYNESELDQIFDVITPMIQFSEGLLEPYEPTGLGKDPREIDRAGVPRGQALPDTEGWKSKENMRWYFENEMGCTAVPGTKEHREKNNTFFNLASSKHNGLNDLYRSWGVSALIDQDIIVPLAIKLISETGLNVESLLALKRDCYELEHPLTGQPYIKYYKERSQGERELHISLFDSEELELSPKQSKIITGTINTILDLTRPLVSNANCDIDDYLFLYQSNSNRFFGDTRLLNTKVLCNWTNKVVERHELKGRGDEPLTFNLSRFRPTLITDLVKSGHDLFEIQSVAGHKSLTTTLDYIDRNGTASEYRESISTALRQIKTNLDSQTEYPLPVAQSEGAEPGEFIFKGPIASCKNPYDPPDEVTSSPYHSTGDACTYWNMCLFCDNVVLTKESLPKLIAYRMQIQTALDRNLDEIPRAGELYRKAASVIDEVISTDAFFSDEEIEWATELAESETDEVLDGFIFQGIS
ncbi:site-specific integrase [Salinibacter ruber]|uniref:site-specific integrase n=2 Tax=Salinibacter ruber TaxID=146919 RepID=UPI00216A9227